MPTTRERYSHLPRRPRSTTREREAERHRNGTFLSGRPASLRPSDDTDLRLSFVKGRLRRDVHPADVPFAKLLTIWLKEDRYRSQDARAEARDHLLDYCTDFERPERTRGCGII
jgi:hypothetical protein